LISPPAPAVCVYSSAARWRAAARFFCRSLIWPVSVFAWSMTAWRAGPLSALLERSPQAPELVERGADAGVAGLGERELDVLQRARAGALVAEGHVLRAVLQVEELVADALVGLHVDAGAEVAGVGAARGRDQHRRRRDELGRLPRVAHGARVGDVVRGDVERALLGEQAAQRGLDAVERGDRHG